MHSLDPFRYVKDDGLPTPEVGPWAEEKYRLLYHYAKMFATSMKGRWDQRVYIDLFAGAGRSRIRDTNKIVLASSLLAIEIPDKFDRYIFCEKKNELLGALRERVPLDKSTFQIQFVEGDVNEQVDNVIEAMPEFGHENKVLGFCFVDPYRMGDIRFSTIQKLASRFIDFLVLIPTGMDAGRNVDNYVRSSNTTVGEFLGREEWRLEWKGAASKNIGFDMFVAEIFSDQMKSLEYSHGGLNKSVLIRSREKHLPLYRLGFYSRHPLGGKFWEEAKKSSTGQQNLFEF